MQQNRKNIFLYFSAPIFVEWFLMLGIQLVLILLGVDIAKYATEVTIAIAAILIPIFWYMHKNSSELEAVWWKEKKKADSKDLLVIALCACCCCLAANILITLSGITRMSKTYQMTSQAIYQAPLWVQILGIIILVPAMEELVYRVILYTRMRAYLPKKVAIIGSALIFGVYHGNVAQFVFAAIIGIVLAYLMEVFRSFKVVFFFHMMVNLTSMICTWTQVFQWVYQDIVIVAGVTVVTTVTAVACYQYLHGKYEMLQKC